MVILDYNRLKDYFIHGNTRKHAIIDMYTLLSRGLIKLFFFSYPVINWPICRFWPLPPQPSISITLSHLRLSVCLSVCAGAYMSVDISQHDVGEKARFQLPVMKENDTHCIDFNYLLTSPDGSSPGTLNVLVKVGPRGGLPTPAPGPPLSACWCPRVERADCGCMYRKPTFRNLPRPYRAHDGSFGQCQLFKIFNKQP